MLWIFLLIFSPSLMASNEYIVGLGGQGKHSQESMSDSSTHPVGLSYGAGMGYRSNFYEFELLATKSNYHVDIVHDGRANTINHEQTIFNLSLNFYLVRRLYVRLGYGLALIKQGVKAPVAGASGAGLNQSYGLVDEKIGVANVGLGYVFWLGSSINLFTQLEHFSMGDISGYQTQLSAGFRWYFK